MKLPYGYVLDGEKIVIHEERADIVRSIFEYYLAGASWGKLLICSLQRVSPPQPETLNGPERPWTSSWQIRNTFQLSA